MAADGASLSRFARRLPLFHFAVDAAIWGVALPITVLVRQDFSTNEMTMRGMVISFVLILIGQATFGYTGGSIAGAGGAGECPACC